MKDHGDHNGDRDVDDDAEDDEEGEADYDEMSNGEKQMSSMADEQGEEEMDDEGHHLEGGDDQDQQDQGEN